MISGRPKSRFEAEVRLGLMAIVFLLLLLNVTSNLILHRARGALEERAVARCRSAAVAVSRLAQQHYPEHLSDTTLGEARQRNGLSGLALVPVRPADDSPESRQDWFRRMFSRMPAERLPEIAERLFAADYLELTRGEGDEYFYLYPIPAGAGHELLIVSVDQPDLAYLDDSRRTIMIVMVAAMAVVGVVYVLLSRMIFNPFRRLRRHAEEAGRPIDVSGDDTEAIVSEYRQAVEQLKANEAELLRLNKAIQERADSFELFNRYLLESATTGALVLDPAGCLVSVNEAAVRLLHLGDHRPGAGLRDVLGHHSDVCLNIEDALHQRTSGGYREYTGLGEDEPETVLGVSVTAITDRTRGPMGVLVFITDLTNLARLTRELEARKRLAALGEMAGGLAHQLRNALGAISGYANLLKKRLSSSGMPLDHAEALIGESRQAESLISRFLTFARPLECSLEPVDLSAIVEDAVAQARARDHGAPVEFVLDLECHLIVEADRVLLKQVFGNVIDNAIQAYGGHAASVEVRLRQERHEVLAVIADHGCGIAPEHLDRIFTPFFSSRPSGNGLGLPLAQRIVDLHHGRIRVSSRLGEGTAFEISLPLSGKAATVGVLSQTPEAV